MTDPLSVSASIAGILALAGSIVSTCYRYGCGVRDGPAEVQKLVEEVVSLAGVLNAIRTVVDGTTASIPPEPPPEPKLAELDLPPAYSVSRAHEHFQQLLEPIQGSEELLQEVQTVLQRADIRHETNKLGRILKRLQWPLKCADTMKLVARLERFKTLYLLCLDVSNNSMTMNMQYNLKEIRQTQLIDMLERRMAEQAAEQRRIASWLCPITCIDAHRAARRLHLDGTGQWMLENPAWQRWLEQDQALLWLYGIPGSGKTVMTSTLLEHCEQGHDERTAAHLAYFYCDFREKDSIRPEVVLGALVSQLAAQADATIPLLKQFVQEHTWQNGELTQPNCDELGKVLVAMLTHVERAIIVIDALDECVDRSFLLELLAKLAMLKTSKVKILVSSRQEGDISAALSQFVQLSIRVDAQNDDIEFYVSCSMANSPRLRRLPVELRETVRTTIVREACGMFRWVQCQIEALSRLRTDRDIRRAVHQLPPTLYGAYERILARIEEADRVVARRALLWLAYAPRALTTIELVEAVVIEDDTHSRDPEAAWNPTDLLSVIGSLARYSSETGHIELAHHSVKEFLETAPLSGPTAFFHLEPNSGRSEVAQRMLTYLLMDDFTTCCVDKEAYAIRLQNYPLLHLAARYWPYYAREPIQHSSPLITELAQSLLREPPPPQFWAWAEVLISHGPYSYRGLHKRNNDPNARQLGPLLYPMATNWKPCPRHLTPLYYATSFGLLPIAQSLLDQGADIDAPGGRFHGTALHAAVYRRHAEILALLLARKANPDICDEHGTSARELALHITRSPGIFDLMSQPGPTSNLRGSMGASDIRASRSSVENDYPKGEE